MLFPPFSWQLWARWAADVPQVDWALCFLCLDWFEKKTYHPLQAVLFERNVPMHWSRALFQCVCSVCSHHCLVACEFPLTPGIGTGTRRKTPSHDDLCSSIFIYVHLCSMSMLDNLQMLFWPKSQTWRDISFISPPVLQTSASHLLAAQGPDLGVQKATNATGPDLGGSLGLIACFPQTLPAKKGDSMGWVNIKKKNTAFVLAVWTQLFLGIQFIPVFIPELDWFQVMLDRVTLSPLRGSDSFIMGTGPWR